MTVCIAAVCDVYTDGDPKVVICTDRLMSSAIGTTEKKHKDHLIDRRWRCLVSGSESEFLAILRLLRDRIPQKATEEMVLEAIRKSLGERKLQKTEELVQARLGISYEEYLATGKDRLPAEIFSGIARDITLMKLTAELLIVGFNVTNKYPSLISTDTEGRVHIRDDFATVGEGAYLASSALLAREHAEADSLSHTLYHAYEAKKYAEHVTSVGKTTWLNVQHRDGSDSRVEEKGFAFLERHYKKLGPKKMPDHFHMDEGFMFKYWTPSGE